MGANWLGTFFGTLIGNALKIVGPEFIAGVIRAVTQDTGEISKPIAEVQHTFSDADDAADKRLRDQIHNRPAGNGGDSGEQNQG